MKNPVESGMTGNSDSRENLVYEVTCSAPSEFTEAELARCIVIIQAGDAVEPGSAARALPRAKVIAVARKGFEIVGSARSSAFGWTMLAALQVRRRVDGVSIRVFPN